MTAYLDRAVERLVQSRRLVLITRGDGRDVERLLAARLVESGLRPRVLGPVPGVYVSGFDREGQVPPTQR